MVMDLAGRIRCCRVLLVVVAALRWAEPYAVMSGAARTSTNKADGCGFGLQNCQIRSVASEQADLRFFSPAFAAMEVGSSVDEGFFGLQALEVWRMTESGGLCWLMTLASSVGGLSSCFAGDHPWRMLELVVGFDYSTFNKLEFGTVLEGLASLFPLVRHHGGGRLKVHDVETSVWPVPLGSWVASICRAEQRQRWSVAVSFGQRGPSALAAQDGKKERFFGVVSLNQRICCPSCGDSVIFLLLAGRGGEGEEGDASAATGFGRRRYVVPEALMEVSIGPDEQNFLQYLCCTGSFSIDGYSVKDTVPFLFGAVSPEVADSTFVVDPQI